MSGAMFMNETLAASPPVKMVILGASYAGSWKEPGLEGYEVINRGASGEETSQMLARFDRDVVAEKPAVVLIWGHINNIHRAPGGDMAAAVERAKGDYRAMVERARANDIRVVLATEVTLTEAVGFSNRVAAFIGGLRGKQGYSARVNGYVREINAWLRDYARTEKLQLLDFEAVFDDGEGFRKREYTSDDGTHISPDGYAALSQFVQSQFRAP
jgi:lysophospholipase L1-like esterase